MRSLFPSIGVAALVLIASACADAPTAVRVADDPAFSSQSSAPSLNLYGLGGLSRAVPRSPCDDPAYREFDFWLGAWDVFDASGQQQIGTNRITRELDSCVIAESWTDAGGGRGRSINTYDSDTDQWHQTWVSANSFGHLRLSGGIVGDEMVLTGVRVSPVFGFTLFTEFRWAVLAPDVVSQTGELRIPAIDVVSTFTGIYHRVPDITPAPETLRPDCQPGGVSEESRLLDFVVGRWRVETKNGKKIGESNVRTDLGGCLFEERFATRKGYEAVVFTYWDRVVARWYRTYIDSEGERIELEGDFEGDRLVLRGKEGVPGGTVDLRVTLVPGTDGFDQLIEVSRDGGINWRPTLELHFVD